MINFKIIKPKHPALQEVVEYFLFIHTSESHLLNKYITYPNTNCCLALYHENTINWDQAQNNCVISHASVPSIDSKLYGWHNRPFKVSVTGKLDQICILFRVNGLSQFTRKPLNRLALNDDPFVEIFGQGHTDFQASLFHSNCEFERAELLERFLLNHLVQRPISLAESYIHYIKNTVTQEKSSIRAFCKQHNISESTLYRCCTEKIGESPKDIEIKIRFRLFLEHLNTTTNLTQLSYFLNYADQSHMIKEVKKLTGLTPKKVSAHIQREHKHLYLTR